MLEPFVRLHAKLVSEFVRWKGRLGVYQKVYRYANIDPDRLSKDRLEIRERVWGRHVDRNIHSRICRLDIRGQLE